MGKQRPMNHSFACDSSRVKAGCVENKATELYCGWMICSSEGSGRPWGGSWGVDETTRWLAGENEMKRCE